MNRPGFLCLSLVIMASASFAPAVARADVPRQLSKAVASRPTHERLAARAGHHASELPGGGALVASVRKVTSEGSLKVTLTHEYADETQVVRSDGRGSEQALHLQPAAGAGLYSRERIGADNSGRRVTREVRVTAAGPVETRTYERLQLRFGLPEAVAVKRAQQLLTKAGPVVLSEQQAAALRAPATSR